MCGSSAGLGSGAAGASFRIQGSEEGGLFPDLARIVWMWGLALAQRIGFHWDLFQMPGPVYCGDGGWDGVPGKDGWLGGDPQRSV